MIPRRKHIPGSRRFLPPDVLAPHETRALFLHRHPFVEGRHWLADSAGNTLSTGPDPEALRQWAIANGYTVRNT